MRHYGIIDKILFSCYGIYKIMKTKTVTHNSSFRPQYRGLMYFSVVILLFCLCKFDGHLSVLLRQMYTQGFGAAGAYMREGEMSRPPIDLGATVRVQTVSGQ